MMRNRFMGVCVVLWLMCVGLAFGQAPATPTAQSNLTFDVATIKPSAPLDMAKMAQQMQAGQMPKLGPHVEGTRAEYNYVALRDLIAIAYKVKGYQIAGPAWMASQRFDIAAKMPDGSSKDDAPAMLQALLKERFKLVAHRETQEHPVFALVVAKGGPKLKASTGVPTPIDESTPLKPGERQMDTADGPMRMTIRPDGTTVMNMGAKGTTSMKVDPATKTIHLDSDTATMAGFADTLTTMMQMGGASARQVVDMTDLKGSYQVSLEISLMDLLAGLQAQGMNVLPGGAPAPEASDPGGGSTIFASVEALGLKLEPRKAPVEQLVVDSVEKTPAEN